MREYNSAREGVQESGRKQHSSRSLLASTPQCYRNKYIALEERIDARDEY